MSLQIPSTSWHARLYEWSRDVWRAFMDNQMLHERTNLCVYLRTLFVGMPLALAAHVGILAYAAYVLLYYPITRFGWGWYFGSITAITTLVLLVMGGVNLLGYLSEQRREWRKERWRERFYDSAPKPEPGTVSAKLSELKKSAVSLTSLVFDYLAARKKQFCPTVEITTPKQKEIQS